MSHRFRINRAIFASILVLCSVLPVSAQFNSNVQGTVTDPSGALVPQAKVTLHNTQLGTKYSAETNSSGFYRFSSLAPGKYKASVEAAGFAAKSVEVDLTTNQTAGTDFVLVLSGTSTQVGVTAEAPVLNPDETRTQSTLSATEIAALPLQNGNVLAVLRTAPGVTGIDEDRNLWVVPIGNTTMNAQANGRPNSSNTYTMDGQSISSNAVNGSILIVPNTDQIAEVAMETTTFAVDNGAGSSAKMNFTTKSGTNQFHGDIQLRYSSKGLVANQAFTSSTAPFKRQWWNGTIGGPIWKDHTFFFFSYLNQRQSAPQSSLDTVETPQFAQWAIQNFPNSKDVQIALAKFPPSNLQITNPASALVQDNWKPDSAGVCMIAGKAAPCNMPYQQTGVFYQSPKVNGDQYNFRADHYFRNSKDRVYFNWYATSQVSDFLWDRPGYNSNTPGNARYANGNYSHVFSQSLVNEASFSYNKTWGGWKKQSGAEDYNVVPFFTLVLGGGPLLFGTPGDTQGYEHNYQIHDNLVWIHGKHSLKFGFEGVRSNYLNDNSGLAARPNSVFFLGGWDSFLLDQPAWYNLGTLSAKDGSFLPQIVGAQVTRFAGFAQDEWKPRPNLLLTLGVRWDDFGNPYNYSNGLPFAQVFPGRAGAFANLSQPAWIGPGQGFAQQISNTYVKLADNAFAGRQWKNFMPRVGVAWSPGDSHKWTVRGGIGMFEDPISLPGVSSNLPTNSFNTLSIGENIFNPAPFNNVSADNLYGTSTEKAPFGYTYPTVKPLGFDSRGAIIRGYATDGTALTYASGLNGVDAHLVPQKSLIYNIAVERLVARNIVVGATYTGSRSWDQQYGADYNSFIGDKIVYDSTQNRLTWDPAHQSQEFGAINFTRNGLSSNYNALILSARQSMRAGLTWNASLTWGKNLAHALGPNPYDTNGYYGPDGSDIRLRFSSSLVYDTTVLSAVRRSTLRSILLGWQISGMGIAQGGSPFSVVTSAAFNPGGGLTDSGDFLGNGNNTALLNIASGAKTSGWTRRQYEEGIFTTGEFSIPAGYGTQPVYSNQGYNMFRNPGYLGIDMNLAKKIVLPWFQDSKSTLTLAVEGTNILNRVNLAGVNNGNGGGSQANNDISQSTSTGTFGKVTSAYQPRIFQLRARFEF